MMKPFLQFDTDDQRCSLMDRARNVVFAALQQYDLAWDKISFIRLSDTLTYKIETNNAGAYLLRIHSDRVSKQEIQSELEFLETLDRWDEMIVPTGIASRDGAYVLEMETERGYRRPHVTLMRWVDGEHAHDVITETQAYLMGQLMGRLHEAARGFVPSSNFVRPTWNADSFREKMGRLELYYSCFLSDESWALYQMAAEKIESELSLMQPSIYNYGLIHADLHPDNLVFKDGIPYPIDFGMCGFGYFLYDMAGALIGLHIKPRLKFIEGYESIRDLEEDHIRELECFFMMFMIENYCHHASDPRETNNLLQEQPLAQAYMRAFLKNQHFLLDVIELVTVDQPAGMDIGH